MSTTVLTVDDSTSVRQLVRFTLEGAGYQVIEAANGQDAVAKMTTAVRLIITDLNMPLLDGIGLIRAVRRDSRFKGVPIIMLTTESNTDKKDEGRAAGATGWIVKPFKPEQLLAVLKKVIG